MRRKSNRAVMLLIDIVSSAVAGASSITIIMILFGFLSNNLFKFYAFLKMCGISQYTARPVVVVLMVLTSIAFFIYFNNKTNRSREKMAIDEVVDVCKKINKED